MQTHFIARDVRATKIDDREVFYSIYCAVVVLGGTAAGAATVLLSPLSAKLIKYVVSTARIKAFVR
jgi:hypothetical protein